MVNIDCEGQNLSKLQSQWQAYLLPGPVVEIINFVPGLLYNILVPIFTTRCDSCVILDHLIWRSLSRQLFRYLDLYLRSICCYFHFQTWFPDRQTHGWCKTNLILTRISGHYTSLILAPAVGLGGLLALKQFPLFDFSRPEVFPYHQMLSWPKKLWHFYPKFWPTKSEDLS